MLLELHIAGLGVIEDVSLELAPGLNALTGETGAGKTMVAAGLGLVLGQRAQAGLVRSGSPRATVEARFEAAEGAFGEWAEDGELVLSRGVGRDGRSTARAGGQLCPASTLAELGRDLVEVHGQNSAQRLLSPSAQTAFLDRFAGRDHLRTLEEYRRTYRRLRSARERLERIDAETREREREKDLLRHQVREIEAAALQRGEVDSLAAEESRLAHVERLRDHAGAAGTALAEEGGGADSLRAAAAALREAATLDPGAASVAQRVASLSAEAEDAAADVRTYLEGLEVDPARLEATRERIAAIRSLERKYGEGEEAVLAFLDGARERLVSLERTGEEGRAIAAEVAELEGTAARLAAETTTARLGAAPRLTDAVLAELAELGMEGARILASLEDEGRLGPDGAERCVLLFSGGEAQEPQPLARVASGGELSRTMLAFRTVLADLDEVPTIVFDEVDSGIGGRAGFAVGRRLARLARRRQVLVVTHLPQIACFADRQFRVTKERGSARVVALEEGERIDELSRMLSGMPTEEAATHAGQLLAEAARERA